jgi:hypothetical protein
MHKRTRWECEGIAVVVRPLSHLCSRSLFAVGCLGIGALTGGEIAIAPMVATPVGPVQFWASYCYDVESAVRISVLVFRPSSPDAGSVRCSSAIVLLFRPPLQWMLGSECKNLKAKAGRSRNERVLVVSCSGKHRWARHELWRRALSLLPDARLDLNSITLSDLLPRAGMTLLWTVKNDELCVRFMGIPGVGPVTALAFKTMVDRADRCRRSSDVGAHLGRAAPSQSLPVNAASSRQRRSSAGSGRTHHLTDSANRKFSRPHHRN